jgi:hypothetical protein
MAAPVLEIMDTPSYDSRTLPLYQFTLMTHTVEYLNTLLGLLQFTLWNAPVSHSKPYETATKLQKGEKQFHQEWKICFQKCTRNKLEEVRSY